MLSGTNCINKDVNPTIRPWCQDGFVDGCFVPFFPPSLSLEPSWRPSEESSTALDCSDN